MGQYIKTSNPLRVLLKRLEVNRAVAFGALAIVRGFVFGPITAALIATYFSPRMQGFHYTFLSLAGLQLLTELGLGNVLIQFASHEWAHLREPGATSETIDRSLSRLASLIRSGLKWYAGIGLATAVALILAGDALMGDFPDVPWRLPWISLATLIGIRISTTPLWSLLEGMGHIADVYRFKLVEGLIAGSIIWIAVLLGANLWVLPIANVVGLLVVSGFLTLPTNRGFFRRLWKAEVHERISWRDEVWRMQWRVALSSISNYCLLWAFTPIVLRTVGPVEAGRFGMTWSLIVGLIQMSSAWVSARAPELASLAAKDRVRALDMLTIRIARASIGVAVLGSTAILSVVIILRAADHPLSQRILPATPTLLLLTGSLFFLAVYAVTSYLRAFKIEPLVWAYVMTGLLIAFLSILVGRGSGSLGISMVYLVVMAGVMLPWSLVVLRRHRFALPLPQTAQ